jgi:hypothetical protein
MGQFSNLGRPLSQAVAGLSTPSSRRWRNIPERQSQLLIPTSHEGNDTTDESESIPEKGLNKRPEKPDQVTSNLASGEKERIAQNNQSGSLSPNRSLPL